MAILAAKPGRRNRALWGFATAIYARPGVAEACLALQDRHGVDIPLLLAAIWHGESGRGRLAAPQLATWRGLARLWHSRTIAPLRAARSAIRDAARADPAIRRLRKSILAAELAAERLLLRDLESTAGATVAPQSRHRRTDARANAATIVRGAGARRALTKTFSALGPTT